MQPILKHGRFQFTIRSMLLFTAWVAFAAGWSRTFWVELVRWRWGVLPIDLTCVLLVATIGLAIWSAARSSTVTTPMYVVEIAWCLAGLQWADYVYGVFDIICDGPPPLEFGPWPMLPAAVTLPLLLTVLVLLLGSSRSNCRFEGSLTWPCAGILVIVGDLVLIAAYFEIVLCNMYG